MRRFSTNCSCSLNLYCKVYDDEKLAEHQRMEHDKTIHEILLKWNIRSTDRKPWFSIQVGDDFFFRIRYYAYVTNMFRGRVSVPFLENGTLIRHLIKFTFCDFYTGEHSTNVIIFDASPRVYEDGVSFPIVERKIIDCGGRSNDFNVRREFNVKAHKLMCYLCNRNETDDLKKDCINYVEREGVLCSLRLMTLVKYFSGDVRNVKNIMLSRCKCNGLLLRDKCICNEVKQKCCEELMFN